MGFLWPVFSSESTILSLYEKKGAKENPYSGIFIALTINGESIQNSLTTEHDTYGNLTYYSFLPIVIVWWQPGLFWTSRVYNNEYQSSLYKQNS